jgi:outer membrane biosynthesis protein TonB
MVFVNEDGQVVDTRVVRASGPTYAHVLLDMASAKAAARCRFKAAPGAPRRAGNVVFDRRLM